MLIAYELNGAPLSERHGAPARLVTPVVVLAGVLSNIAADAGYLVLVPLGAVVFYGTAVVLIAVVLRTRVVVFPLAVIASGSLIIILSTFGGGGQGKDSSAGILAIKTVRK